MKIAGIGDSELRINEITADDIAAFRNFIGGYEYGVISGFNVSYTSDGVTLGKGQCFAYGYMARLEEEKFIPFNKTAADQYHFIYAEIDRSVVPNKAEIKTKNNQGSPRVLETTFRQDQLSYIKTGIFQLPLYRVKIDISGVLIVEPLFSVLKGVWGVVATNTTSRVIGSIASNVTATTQNLGDNSKKIATTAFTKSAVQNYINQGGISVYSVTMGSGVGVKNTYSSISSNALYGSPSGTTYIIGTTVYIFVVMNEGYKPVGGTLISGVECIDGAIYRIASQTLAADWNYGNISTTNATPPSYTFRYSEVSPEYQSIVFKRMDSKYGPAPSFGGDVIEDGDTLYFGDYITCKIVEKDWDVSYGAWDINSVEVPQYYQSGVQQATIYNPNPFNVTVNINGLGSGYANAYAEITANFNQGGSYALTFTASRQRTITETTYNNEVSVNGLITADVGFEDEDYCWEVRAVPSVELEGGTASSTRIDFGTITSSSTNAYWLVPLTITKVEDAGNWNRTMYIQNPNNVALLVYYTEYKDLETNVDNWVNTLSTLSTTITGNATVFMTVLDREGFDDIAIGVSVMTYTSGDRYTGRSYRLRTWATETVEDNKYNWKSMLTGGVTAYPVTMAAGRGVSGVYSSTNLNATSGNPSGTTYANGTTVYMFAVMQQGYKMASGTLISGIMGQAGSIWRIASNVISGNWYYGTIDGVSTTGETWHTLWSGSIFTGWMTSSASEYAIEGGDTGVMEDTIRITNSILLGDDYDSNVLVTEATEIPYTSVAVEAAKINEVNYKATNTIAYYEDGYVEILIEQEHNYALGYLGGEVSMVEAYY